MQAARRCEHDDVWSTVHQQVTKVGEAPRARLFNGPAQRSRIDIADRDEFGRVVMAPQGLEMISGDAPAPDQGKANLSIENRRGVARHVVFDPLLITLIRRRYWRADVFPAMRSLHCLTTESIAAAVQPHIARLDAHPKRAFKKPRVF